MKRVFFRCLEKHVKSTPGLISLTHACDASSFILVFRKTDHSWWRGVMKTWKFSKILKSEDLKMELGI